MGNECFDLLDLATAVLAQLFLHFLATSKFDPYLILMSIVKVECKKGALKSNFFLLIRLQFGFQFFSNALLVA